MKKCSIHLKISKRRSRNDLEANFERGAGINKDRCEKIPRKCPNEASQELSHIMIEEVNQETLLCIIIPLTKSNEANSKIINPLFLNTDLIHGYTLKPKVLKKRRINKYFIYPSSAS